MSGSPPHGELREALAERGVQPWLDHISYAVSDYRKSTAFYRDLMGWEIRNDDGKGQCTLKIGEVGEIIIRNRREPAANAAPGQNGRPPLTGVINHVSYGIEPWSTEGVKAELEKRGLKPRPDMVGDNFKSYHVTDPNGMGSADQQPDEDEPRVA